MKRQLPLLAIILLVCLGTNTFAQAPVNDNCADAIPINEVVDSAFTTVNANSDGPFHLNPPCPGSGTLDSFFHDIWYLYTPTHDGYSRFTLCGTATFDSKIAVYNGGATCPLQDGDLLSCNEDASNCAGSTSEIIFAVESSQSYLLRLAGFGPDTTGESGTGTFTVEKYEPLFNDFCGDAAVVTIGDGQAFSNVGAITDGPEHPNNAACFGFNDNTVGADIWYSFTPDFTGTVQWSTCDLIPFDSRMAVYGPNVSCPVQDGDLYTCNDDGSGCDNYTSLVNFEVEAGSTYILRLGGFNEGQGSGVFDLKEITPIIPPENDFCADATGMPVIDVQTADNLDTFTLGTTINATFELNNFIYPYCLGNTNGGEFADVYFSFNNQGIEEIELRMNVLTANSAFLIDLWRADCLDRVDSSRIRNNCILTNAGDNMIRDTFSTLADTPTDYILRVTTRLTSELPGDFFLQLVSPLVTSNEEVTSPASLSFFPNPATDRLHLQLDLTESVETNFQVVNTLGQVLTERRQGKLSTGNHQMEFNISNLPNGLYFLVMDTGNHKKSFRFVKE